MKNITLSGSENNSKTSTTKSNASEVKKSMNVGIANMIFPNDIL